MPLEFEAFPKIPRLNRGMVITEKIDGTNACVVFSDDGSEMLVQSRNRAIEPGKDNAGFAAWCHENRDSLFADLGPGRHFGEWWGRGIQRNYGLDHKRFSLFNTGRWYTPAEDESGRVHVEFSTTNLGVVPLIHEGPFDHRVIDTHVQMLKMFGSRAANFNGAPAEGVVVYLPAARQLFKVLCENDDIPKGVVA